MEAKMNLLLLDDDSLVRQAWALAGMAKHKIIPAGTYAEALSLLERKDLDAAIIDINLGDEEMTGIDFLLAFKARFPDRPAIMGSGRGDVDTVVKCLKLGADDYIEKPFGPAELEKKLAKFSIPRERSASELDSTSLIVGESEGILKAKRKVEQAQNLRILFYGETGVGKTPFARYSNEIVSRAEGRKRPFEQVNCACLSHEHFQDQLFGHKRGAFTGAIADKKGLVELAKGGDLFLDEIGDMPLETQAHFLTFLDTMEYYPLGEDRKRQADVRVLCATNRDLKKMVEAGTFRKDLYSRISQVIVDIPPLRDRGSDVELLFRHFVREFSGGPKSIDLGLIDVLANHSWEEGNVRELRDVAEYLSLMSRNSDRIEREHLGEGYRQTARVQATAAAEGVPAEDIGLLSEVGLELYLDQVEKKLLEKYLHQNLGSLESMAKQLRISRPTLYRRLKKYSIMGVKDEAATQYAFR